ncbi:MAG TPA: TRAP transporter large permease subunit, partial [Paracoccus sp.]|nr:TRAP transporter large permease subunit [Paracoccus sp. (in: a-proteobacteria)]
ILLPIVQEMGIDQLWFVVLMAVVLQTSFLSPPFGYALFYMRSLAPKDVTYSDIVLGVLPFIALIIVMAIVIGIFPQLVTWLPESLYQN